MQVRISTAAKAVIGVITGLVLLALLLSAINWNFAKPWISERVSEATGRSFAIHGDLVFSWSRPQNTASGWRRLVPWPHLRARELTLGNPDWATTGPTMATVPQLDFTLSPLALFRKTLRVSSLILSQPDLVLEMGEEGQTNWTFKQREKTSNWQLDLQDLSLADGKVRLVDAVRKADVTALIDSLDDGSVTWKIDGKLDQDKVSGSGKAGALLSLRDSDTRYPLHAQLQIGQTDIRAEGTITDPRDPSALDVDLTIKGASMAELFAFTGIVLPQTPHFSTKGRLVGSLAKDDFNLRYEKFTGKAGASVLAGTLVYRRQQPRPLLSGTVVSNQLHLKDLGALFGSSEKSAQPKNKVLPVAPFRTERWDKLDANIDFTGKTIIRGEKLPINNLSAKVQLDNSVLTLAPLNFGVAGGSFNTELRIDGSSKPAKARLKIAARSLKLSRLFPKVEAMDASIGQIHGDALLTGAGNSFSALAGSANGEVKAFITEGTVSKMLLETMGLNLGSLILTQIFGDSQVELHCLASDFKVADGVMQPRVFVVDTEDALITLDGQINLANEQLDLTIYPESKGVRLLSLRAPLHVKGSFKNPQVGVDKGVVGLKAGAAIALGALAAPLAALLALIQTGPEEESPCAKLLAQAKQKPTAPAPGKAAGGK